jgi:hypothetical protein
MADFITVDRKRTYTVRPLNAAMRLAQVLGVPQVDGSPVWTVYPLGGVSLIAAPDGLSCEVIGIIPQSQTLTVTADADMGAGVSELEASVIIETVA